MGVAFEYVSLPSWSQLLIRRDLSGRGGIGGRALRLFDIFACRLSCWGRIGFRWAGCGNFTLAKEGAFGIWLSDADTTDSAVPFINPSSSYGF